MTLEALWIFLPAGIANMAPVLCSQLPVLKNWNAPMDGGRSYRGVRIFGKNKTWRGLWCGTVVAALFSLLQFRLITPSDDSTLFLLALGALLGFGALIGDALASFAKRQRGIAPGQPWIPVDQTDYIFGALIVAAPLLFQRIDLLLVAVIILCYGGLHVVFSYIGFLLGLKKSPI